MFLRAKPESGSCPFFLVFTRTPTVREVMNHCLCAPEEENEARLGELSIMLASLVLEVRTGSRRQGHGIESHPQ